MWQSSNNYTHLYYVVGGGQLILYTSNMLCDVVHNVASHNWDNWNHNLAFLLYMATSQESFIIGMSRST